MKKILPILIFLLAACSRPEVTLFVGTYSDGFYALDFNSGEVIAKAEMPNPSFLSVNGDLVYAVSEMPDTSASVWAWRLGGKGFELLGSQPTGLPEKGEDPCYVASNGKRLAVANYSGGTLALYKLQADGHISPLDSLIISGIGGPDLSRQETPHVHCAVFTPDGKHLLFSEFSADAIGSVEYTAESKAKIDAAKEAYDALGAKLQPAIENAETLTDAEAAYAVLKPSCRPRRGPWGRRQSRQGSPGPRRRWG